MAEVVAFKEITRTAIAPKAIAAANIYLFMLSIGFENVKLGTVLADIPVIGTFLSGLTHFNINH